MKSPTIVVLGGGVAGMSAAQEAAERGLTVRVFEKRNVPGGKARSMYVPRTGTDGRRDLPGEHGFRFFPGFYRHITDTMSRIPVDGHTAFDNLVAADREMLARGGKKAFVMPASFPRDLADLELILHDFSGMNDLGIAPEDMAFFARRLWQLVTSCAERKADEYERISWWEFMQAAQRGPGFRQMLVTGLTRTLVAANAKLASTQVGGEVLTELIYGATRPGPSSDRLLNGPTSEVWLEPWKRYLLALGVDYRTDTAVTAIHMDGGRVGGVTVTRDDGITERVTGDYYVAALPVEVMDRLLTDEMLTADPGLAGIRVLTADTAWMNGIQFFLTRREPIVSGHVTYIDSPWALTSISQAQFWGDDLSRWGDGTVQDVLSVDISDWTAPGTLFRKPDGTFKTAAECDRREIHDEVWAQLTREVNVGRTVLTPDMVHAWFLDDDIERERGGTHDAEPLLVNRTHRWNLRPDAFTNIPNLFLASDYVRTFTNLATMEAANEAARRAVNCILDAAGVDRPKCAIWPLYQPWVLWFYHWHDRRRLAQGLPWDESPPWILRALARLLHLIAKLFHRR